jgi:hypothetical protein
MRYISRLNPFAAINDLRRFLSQQPKHRLWFMMLSFVIVFLVLFAFVKDSHFEKPYKQDIVYVEQWKADRTDAEIVAKQKIDQVEIDRLKAEFDAQQKERQAQFKRLDDKLKSFGI